jgi:hypothetical protein
LPGDPAIVVDRLHIIRVGDPAPSNAVVEHQHPSSGAEAAE